MKIKICDICYKDKKLIEATKVRGFKGNRDIKVEMCNKCSEEVNKLNKVEFVKLAYSLDGLKLTDKEAKNILNIKKWLS